MKTRPSSRLAGPRELWIAVIAVAIVLGAFWSGYQFGKGVALRENAAESSGAQPGDERPAG